MSPFLVGLVLLAALLHASWNALVKLGADRLVAMAILSGSSGLIGAALMPFVPIPAPASWPFIAATSFIHVGYFWFLSRAYETGDFALVYPVARGTAPLLTTIGAFLLVGELPGPVTLIGILAIALGILSLAFVGNGGITGGKDGNRPLLFALLTGCFIASYTLIDGIGVRLSGSVGGYTAWVFAFHGLPYLVLVAAIRRGDLIAAVRANWKPGALGGALSFGAYFIVLWAFSLGALGPVAALRETSVVFAALIGAVFMGERLGLRRVLAALLVATGIVVLAL